MTPLQALGVLDKPGATLQEQDEYRQKVFERVIENTSRAGEYNLSKSKAETRKWLEPLAVNDRVLVAAPVKRKKHGVDRGYATLKSMFFLLRCVDIV